MLKTFMVLVLAALALTAQEQPPAPALVAQFLGFSDSQTAQFQKLLQNLPGNIGPLQQQAARAQQSLEQLANSDNPDPAAIGARLAALYASGHQVPLNQLEGEFQGYSTAEASVAYAESLAAVEYIRSTYGLSDVARLLQRLGEGQSLESAMRSTIHAGYAELETEITNYLQKNYGS